MSASTFTQLRASAALTVRAPSLRATLMLVIPALAAAIGLYFYLVSGRYVSTDNAYVGAQKVLITPEVSGKVVRITVTEGQQLSPGDELFSIDPVPYRLAAQEAEARLARIKTDFDNLKSSLASLGKQIELGRQSVAANQADFDRKTSLLNNRISTPSDLDKSRVLLMASKSLLEQLVQQEASRATSCWAMALPLDKYPQYIEATVASTAPGGIWPTRCCAPPSPASPRR
jgi:membrane fusion protein (multidrug efflux system)